MSDTSRGQRFYVVVGYGSGAARKSGPYDAGEFDSAGAALTSARRERSFAADGEVEWRILTRPLAELEEEAGGSFAGIEDVPKDCAIAWGLNPPSSEPEEAELLALAESQGILYLVLRNLTDQDPMSTSGATISSLLDTERGKEPGTKVADNASAKTTTVANSAKPVKKTKRQPKVRIEVIRGMEREEMLFDNP